MGKNLYFWQGEPVKTDFGVAYVKECLDKPLFWYNFECNWDITLDKRMYGTDKMAMIPAIKITTINGESFIISNHFGIGTNKLRKGGWPDHIHFSFPLGVDKFEGSEELGCLRNEFSLRHFDEESYSQHEAKREIWQKDNFPKEFEESERIKKAFKDAKRV